MKDKSALQVLQNVLGDLEGLAKSYRADPKISTALHNVYHNVAIAGSAIIDKMTRDAKVKKKEDDADKFKRG